MNCKSVPSMTVNEVFNNNLIANTVHYTATVRTDK